MDDANIPPVEVMAGHQVEDSLAEGKVDIAAGDFVGRDKAVFAGRDTIVHIYGDVHGEVSIYPDTTVGRAGNQIERLRGRVTRLIPAEESIFCLSKLREPSTIGGRLTGEFGVTVPLLGLGTATSRWVLFPSAEKKPETFDSAEEYLSALSYIEAQLSPEMEPQKLSELLQRLSAITDEVNVRIARLNSLFVRLVYPAVSSRELVENMVSKIGHRELRQEGKMHLGVVSQLVEKLDVEQLTGKDIDVLSDEAQAAVGVMTQLEKHRLVVERLIQSDRRRRNWTVGVVIAYIGLAVALIVLLALHWGTQFLVGQAPLDELKLPLLGIPWPVIVWSLIGSFAAMIYRFNRRPIHDFSDAVKWMLTRPVQGVVLGAAFYLVLVSGLFLLTGGASIDTSSSVAGDEVILVLCFLVGFSDRFADSVFRTLVERYATIKSVEQQESDDD